MSNALYLCMALFMVHRLVRPVFRLDKTILLSILRLTTPIGIAAVLTLVQMRADTFMLAYMRGDIDVGLYNAAYRFLDMAVIVAVMVTNPLMPIFARYALHNRDKLASNFYMVTEMVMAIIIPVAVITPFVSKSVLGLFFGQEFSVASPALDIMAWIGVLTFISMLNYTVLVSVEVLAFQMWLTALSAVMNVVLNLFMIPKYGFVGAAWTTLLTEILLAGVSFVYVCRHVGHIGQMKRLVVVAVLNLLLFMFLVLNITDDIILSVVSGFTVYFVVMCVTGILPCSKAALQKRLTV
jgi:O-antigen/teichoic acid export membrane protein